MKKLIITVVFALTAALTGMTTWAAAIGSGTLKKDFSSGSTLSSAEMNNNFSVIENAVNGISSSQATLPDGVSTYLSFYFAAPADYVAGSRTLVIPYWSGCEGTDVRLGFLSKGYVVGDNIYFVTPTVMSTLSVPNSSALGFTIASSGQSVSVDISSYNFMNFTIGREGADALDTCTGDLRLWGIRLLYPTSGSPKRLFIPVNTLSR